ncbi:PP2C family serine/threonine-protein phosphatase [Streptomyces sp. NPDC001595]|uniref:PP2C family serine/threonine-protein phosphatase n=1 Tax=Streptomyces sp. NPDC001532 TaxID=3154520 RepID=UPI00332641A9
MSQMPPRQAALTQCPSCAEPLEPGDRYCGACGYDLSAVPPQPQQSPTPAASAPRPPAAHGPSSPTAHGPSSPTADGHASPVVGGATPSGTGGPVSGVNGSVPPPPAAPPAAPAAWPATAAAPDGAPGGAVPPQAAPPSPPSPTAHDAHAAAGPAGAEASGVRFDRRVGEPDDYPLQAPDPRVAEPAPAPTTPAAPAADPAKLCVACRAGRVDGDGYCENCGHAQPRERDHMEQECGPVAAVSDRGLRHHRNEDAFTVATAALPDGSPAVVAIVCDGVSSATRPDDASLAASQAAGATLIAALPLGTHPQQAMHEAIVAASHAVNSLAEEPATAREHAPHQNAPACTLVGAIVTGELLVVGWVGDSRAYWVPLDRTAPAARLTEDDSWAAQMVAAGLMSEAEAYADERAHAITGWLGADAYELEPHTASFKPDRPGVVVVCTDGLWNYAEAAEQMADVLPLDAAVRPLHSAQVLVGHALDGGGHDNVTVAVLPFPAPPQRAGSA